MPEFPVLRNKNIYIIFGLTLMAVMGVASITPAFPSIADHFGIDYKKVGLLIVVFTIPGLVLTPVLGILADRYGRKTILAPSLFLFAIAGFSCSQANNFNTLLWLRFFQGIGAASLGSLNITLIGDIFPEEQRATAIGFNSSILGIGTALYPFVGGALTMIAWNFPFYFPLFGIVAGLMVIFVLDSPHTKTEEPLKSYLSKTWKAIANKNVLGIFLLTVFTFIILYGPFLIYIPFVMKTNFASSAFLIGVILSATSFANAVIASQLGRLNKIIKNINLLKISYLLYIVSLCMIPFLPRESLMIIPAILFGIAQGLNIPNLQTLLVGLSPMEYRGAFMSLNGFLLRLGQTIAPIIAGLFFAYGGIQMAFLGGAIIAFLMLSVVFLLLNKTM